MRFGASVFGSGQAAFTILAVAKRLNMSSRPAGDKRLMTEDTLEQKQADSVDRVTEHEREAQSVASPDRSNSRPASTYVVRLQHDLQVSDATRLLCYISDFGFGVARAHALDGGWCLRLSSLADLQLLSSQCAELIEGHDIEYSGESQ
jgi:hypothetical protein